jgi:ABC-type transporter Mla subunit MlaD
VSLEFDDDSTADPLSEGDVIERDRSQVARETEQTLNDLLPLLRALKPSSSAPRSTPSPARCAAAATRSARTSSWSTAT